MKLHNEELDEILNTGALELAQSYAPDEKYRKDAYLFTRCKTCGTEAHYRLKYILDKNRIGEKVCRCCYWLTWYNELIVSKSGEYSKEEAQKLAQDHGYELIEIRRGELPGQNVFVVRCTACGRQTAERPADIYFGCTCRR